MATNKQLKFFKGASAPSTPAAGMIWFCTSDRTIRVYTGSEWEKYAGLVNASWNDTDKKLVITDAAGSTTTLDLSDCASASDISSKIQTINNTLDSHNTRINTAQSAAEGAQSHSEGVAANLAAEVKTRGEEIASVEGLITAEAATARAAEQANAAAASAADTKAGNAQTYAEGVNTALGQEVTRAKEAEEHIAGLVSAEETRAKAEEERLAGLITTAASGATTEVAKASGATHITVTTSTGDNGQKIYTIGESDIASAQALSDEIAARGVAEQGLSNRIDDLAKADTGRVSVLESKVAALASATHFLGVKNSTDEVTAPAAGDIVIVGNKEYVYDTVKGWVELGDTTDEAGRISTLESWKTTASGTIEANTAAIESNDADILALQNRAKAIEDTMATDAELEAVRSDLQGKINTANASIENHGGRIEALESTANALGTTYVKVSDYNTYKGEVSGKFTAVEGRVSTLEGFQATTEAALESIATAQGVQDQGISDAKALGQQGINDAADALAEAQAKVASVTSGDSYAVVDNTDAKNPKVKVNVVGEVAEGNTGIVTGGKVFDALCWVEFN